ncbi:glycosyltransferase family 2 protein [Aerococcaceae bacterium DSM 111020]|nr:glycosyltransferase family 2 protein [Aerococcaceae bacterium DSM 111020]
MRLSVIIPVYNAADSLKRTIDSVLNQSFNDYEILLVNDGSKDHSAEVVDDYAASDERIKAFHQENKGTSGARNTGVRHAQGEFLLFLDSDDEILPDLLADFEAVVSQETVDLFIFPLLYEDYSLASQGKERLTQDKEWVLDLLYQRPDMSFFSCNKIYRRTLFEHFDFPEGIIYEDNVTTLKSIHQAETIYVRDKPGYIYHQTVSSAIRNVFKPAEMDNITERLRMLKLIEAHYPALYERMISHLHTGMTSTMSKIAGIEDATERKYYAQDVLDYVAPYDQAFRENPYISKQQRAKYRLFKLSPTLYAKIYQWTKGK